MGRGDHEAGEVVDLAEVAAVCAAVVGCYDGLLVGDPTVTGELGRALNHARQLGRLSGRLGWAFDVVAAGASGATPGELAEAIETLRRAAAITGPTRLLTRNVPRDG